MRITELKNKVAAIMVKDYDHEVPDKLRSKDFQRLFNCYMRSVAKNIGGTWHGGGCYCEASGFVECGDKFVYVCTNDYRWRDWSKRILFRAAESLKDYRGGSNNFADLEELEDKIKNLLRR